MKYLAPHALPALSQLLPILGDPSPREISRYLDVSERTIFAWKAADRAPKSAILALFWESSYGRATIDAELHNAATAYKLLSDSLSRQNTTLAARIARLEKIGSFDSANAPYMDPVAAPSSPFFMAARDLPGSVRRPIGA